MNQSHRRIVIVILTGLVIYDTQEDLGSSKVKVAQGLNNINIISLIVCLFVCTGVLVVQGGKEHLLRLLLLNKEGELMLMNIVVENWDCIFS